MRRLIAVPAARVPIIMVFIFFMKSSETKFGRSFFLKIVFPSFSFFVLSFFCFDCLCDNFVIMLSDLCWFFYLTFNHHQFWLWNIVSCTCNKNWGVSVLRPFKKVRISFTFLIAAKLFLHYFLYCQQNWNEIYLTATTTFKQWFEFRSNSRIQILAIRIQTDFFCIS